MGQVATWSSSGMERVTAAVQRVARCDSTDDGCGVMDKYSSLMIRYHTSKKRALNIHQMKCSWRGSAHGVAWIHAGGGAKCVRVA